jgi:ketosteroid isomerase-like protein
MTLPTVVDSSDDVTVRQLNEEYIDALLKSDVGWYSEHLAEDFRCITSDGLMRDKSQFLGDVAAGSNILDYELQDVHVRFYGCTAIVQAKGVFTRKDGNPGQSRYTDIYLKTDDSWRVVSAQITRLPSEGSF